MQRKLPSDDAASNFLDDFEAPLSRVLSVIVLFAYDPYPLEQIILTLGWPGERGVFGPLPAVFDTPVHATFPQMLKFPSQVAQGHILKLPFEVKLHII